MKWMTNSQTNRGKLHPNGAKQRMTCSCEWQLTILWLNMTFPYTVCNKRTKSNLRKWIDLSYMVATAYNTYHIGYLFCHCSGPPNKGYLSNFNTPSIIACTIVNMNYEITHPYSTYLWACRTADPVWPQGSGRTATGCRCTLAHACSTSCRSLSPLSKSCLALWGGCFPGKDRAHFNGDWSGLR